MFEKELEVKAFAAIKKNAAQRKSTPVTITPDKQPKVSRKDAGPKLMGFACNMLVEKIIGANNEPGELFFLI